jgi:chorismate mutase
VLVNSQEAIERAGEALVRQILEVHGLSPDQVISCLISQGSALDAGFAAKGVRRLDGFERMPLLSTVGSGSDDAARWRLEVLAHVAHAEG